MSHRRAALIRYVLFILVLCILVVPIAAKVGEVLAAGIKAVAAHIAPPSG